MSFALVCASCGAASGPSVGVCPYCKSILSHSAGEGDPVQLKGLQKVYQSGNLARALRLAEEALKADSNLKSNAEFAVTLAKIWIETEAPTSRILAALERAHMAHPNHQEVIAYLEIVEAKKKISGRSLRTGIQILEIVLRRHPDNPHANFLLGAALLHSIKDPIRARPFLQKAVTRHENFLRAWACLGALFEQLDAPEVAARCYEKALKLENDDVVKEFFKNRIQYLRRAA